MDMKLKKSLAMAPAAIFAPILAHAQEAPGAEGAFASVEALGALNVEMVFIFNTLLFLLGGILVFWMAAGFTMLEAGFVRSKNVTIQLSKNVGLFAITAVLYYLIGFNLMYPGEGWLVDGWLGTPGPAVLEAVGITAAGAVDVGYASVGSDFFFQLMFCATTASIVSGTLAERIRLNAFFVFVVVLTALVYPVRSEERR